MKCYDCYEEIKEGSEFKIITTATKVNIENNFVVKKFEEVGDLMAICEACWHHMTHHW